MEKGNRRNFLKTSLAAIPALLVTNSLANGQIKEDGEEIFEAAYNVVMQPGAFINLDSDYNFKSVTPWAINANDQDLIPYILGEKSVFKKKGNKLQSNAVIEQSSASNDIQERLSDFQFLGALPTAELISEIGTARYEGKSLDVNIQVFDELTSQVPRTPIIDKTVQVLSFEIPQTSEYVRWPVTGFGYKLQFRGPDVGGLSGCAPEAPRHYSLELFKSAGNGRYNYIANYHIAIWRANGRICFALANNYGRPRCFKTCTPSYNDIRSPIQQALSSNGVNSAVASALAATMAALIIGSIFVLAL